MDFKPLNRDTNFSVAQKAALKKVFTAAEQAAKSGSIELITSRIVHTVLSGWFSGDDKHDLMSLFKHIRIAVTAHNSSYNIISVIGGFHMNGSRRRLLKQLTDQIIEQVV